ncbi:FecR domain-containing protein [Membranicola marinus]|uniref:FecR domain-containing protein n=1 Tax=Membranihabitans marinus TaxID=1227546 RepID=A0A953HNR4_9BACT|nr:FecR domain-containing protein [Membranihabitans marinus]MBY5959379.1 FecR domain-containing protein [Membranihabitans marinus]
MMKEAVKDGGMEIDTKSPDTTALHKSYSQKMNDEEINQLIKKYRNNELSDTEFQDFLLLLRNKDEVTVNLMLDEAKADWVPSRSILLKMQETQINRNRATRRKRLFIWSSAAAVVLLIVGYFLFTAPQVQEDIVYQTGYGETLHIELPDGSTALLNANSSLTWKGDWEKNHLRQVSLDGEAFFDVTKKEKIPFEVDASVLRVHVLGTEFNVRNRPNDVDVFLHEGKVDVRVKQEEVKELSMKPGDFIHFDKADENMTIDENKRIGKKAAWVDGMLEFENREIQEILKEYEILYGKKFKIENAELANKRMDFSLPYSDWDLVRKALGIALGAEFNELGDTIIVK